MDPKFNYNLLLLGRQARGMNQASLAKRAGITQGHLSKIENGLIEPTEEILKLLAESLDFPDSFFCQSDRVYGPPVSVHPMHRKKASVGRNLIERINSENNIRIMHIGRLLRAVELSPEVPLPQFDIDEYGGDAEKIADLVRRTWLLPQGPLQNLTECIERAGALIIWCYFGAAIDGITLSIPGMPHCIFLNRDQPADRMRFTLAHELGHVVMHRIPNPEMEDQAMEFASALLMPSADIRRTLTGGLTLRRLASLKPIWKVSMQGLLMRAKTTRAITENQSHYLWKQINIAKIRFQEPPELDFPHEQPKALAMILKLHLEQLGYSIADLAKSLHIHESEFRQMYQFFDTPQRRGHLNVVP